MDDKWKNNHPQQYHPDDEAALKTMAIEQSLKGAITAVSVALGTGYVVKRILPTMFPNRPPLFYSGVRTSLATGLGFTGFLFGFFAIGFNKHIDRWAKMDTPMGEQTRLEIERGKLRGWY